MNATTQNTAASMAPAIGSRVLIDTGIGLSVWCVIVDVRTNWGRLDYKVRPEAGTGEVFVSSSRVQRTPK